MTYQFGTQTSPLSISISYACFPNPTTLPLAEPARKASTRRSTQPPRHSPKLYEAPFCFRTLILSSHTVGVTHCMQARTPAALADAWLARNTCPSKCLTSCWHVAPHSPPPAPVPAHTSHAVLRGQCLGLVTLA